MKTKLTLAPVVTVLAALLLTVFTTSAGADTLEVTGGEIIESVLSAGDVFGEITGTGFVLDLNLNNGIDVPGLFAGTTHLGFELVSGVVNGTVYVPRNFGPGGIGSGLELTLMHDPLPASFTLTRLEPPEPPFPITEPFSMTGTFLGVTATGHQDTFNLFGQGTLNASYLNSSNPSTSCVSLQPCTDFLQVAFQFTPVPEPSSLLLLSAGLAGLGGVARRKLWK